MAFRKRTLRTMSPTARKVARLIGEIESSSRRLKNLIPEFQTLDMKSSALKNSKTHIPFNDTDLWGLECAMSHGLADGYFLENKEWALAMLARLHEMRGPLFKEATS